jgi:DNA-binding MarR family transcriptional regulator
MMPGLGDREELAWRSLVTMYDGILEYIERRLRQEGGLSSADYAVLAHLVEAPQRRLRSFELGAALHWEKSRLSQHLVRMENRGLVSREACESDQRGKVIVLTPLGRDLIRDTAPQHAADVRAALIDQLTPEELEMFITVGGKVRERLSALDDRSLATSASA